LTGWNGAAGSVGGAPQPGTWYHLVGAYDGTALNGYIYVNGVQVKSAAVADLAQNTAATFNIGDRGDGAPWAGRIDEVAVYSGVLSSNRVAAHYYAGQPPKLTITKNGSSLSVAWPQGQGVLYEANDVGGPYTVVNPVTNPYPVTPSLSRHYYLLKTQ
jgi:hypothetical protein